MTLINARITKLHVQIIGLRDFFDTTKVFPQKSVGFFFFSKLTALLLLLYYNNFHV
jgi:hypothetical protein